MPDGSRKFPAHAASPPHGGGRLLASHAERIWGTVTKLTLGYGYRPSRAIYGLLGAVAVAVVLALGSGGGLAQAQTSSSAAPANCTIVERIGFGLDLGAPLVSTEITDNCHATATAAGQSLTVTSWVLHLLAWAFATLFIAGLTGAVRKL